MNYTLQWRCDSPEGYVENAQVYKIEQNGSDERNQCEIQEETYLRKRIKQRMR